MLDDTDSSAQLKTASNRLFNLGLNKSRDKSKGKSRNRRDDRSKSRDDSHLRSLLFGKNQPSKAADDNERLGVSFGGNILFSNHKNNADKSEERKVSLN
jgi:hypothetical protein